MHFTRGWKPKIIPTQRPKKGESEGKEGEKKAEEKSIVLQRGEEA